MRCLGDGGDDDEGEDAEEDEFQDPLLGWRQKAGKQVDAWNQLWLSRVRALRSLERRSLYGPALQLQRCVGEVALSFLVKHETFRSV